MYEQFDAAYCIGDKPIRGHMVFAVKRGVDAFGFQTRSYDMGLIGVEECSDHDKTINDFVHAALPEFQTDELALGLIRVLPAGRKVAA